MKKELYVVFSLLGLVGYAQEKDVLHGKILTDTLQPQSINIINLTKGLGTINDDVGYFQIKAEEGDTIVFSSVQHYQKTHIVTKKDLKKANLAILLVTKVNELDEVIVSQYDLSGEVKEDIKKIETYEDNLPMFNAKVLDETPFIKEMGVKTVKNRVIVDEMDATPVNLIAVGRMVASLFKKKDKTNHGNTRIRKITDFYQATFIVEELEIPATELYNFLDYINEQAETKKILKTGDELRVLEHLIQQSKIFNDENQKRK
ncbi:hypothetical protein GCM10009430_12320 [Aquimarina litoralis]|uniref:CarboxypepD_reg-like domain-containing protein n=1 Tax=Aquimarina litoralis TaxID=584605 RepID=A0ABN1ILG3_9FLAO